jgi:hypothetical protein
MFATEIWMNRRPGGNGAVRDEPTDAEQLATIIRKLQGSNGGWVQVSGPGKFMTITSEGAQFAVSVTVPGKPPKRSGIGHVDVQIAIDAAVRFMETGALLEKFTWSAA